MHAKLTEIIGINKVNINLRHPALNAIFTRIFLKINSLFLVDSTQLTADSGKSVLCQLSTVNCLQKFIAYIPPEIHAVEVDMGQYHHGPADGVLQGTGIRCNTEYPSAIGDHFAIFELGAGVKDQAILIVLIQSLK